MGATQRFSGKHVGAANFFFSWALRRVYLSSVRSFGGRVAAKRTFDGPISPSCCSVSLLDDSTGRLNANSKHVCSRDANGYGCRTSPRKLQTVSTFLWTARIFQETRGLPLRVASSAVRDIRIPLRFSRQRHVNRCRTSSGRRSHDGNDDVEAGRDATSEMLSSFGASFHIDAHDTTATPLTRVMAAKEQIVGLARRLSR